MAYTIQENNYQDWQVSTTGEVTSLEEAFKTLSSISPERNFTIMTGQNGYDRFNQLMREYTINYNQAIYQNHITSVRNTYTIPISDGIFPQMVTNEHNNQE